MGQEVSRYKRICKLDILEICPLCEVELQKGALLWDRKAKNSIMQLKFFNYSDKNLKSLYITYNCKDEQGNIINQKDFSFSYIDANCESHSAFGTKTPVVLPSELVRNVDVFVKTIVWEDNSITNVSQSDYIKVEKQKSLSSELSEEDIEIYRRACKLLEGEIFLQREIGNNGWQCACGSTNLKQNCRNCKANKEELSLYLDKAQLSIFKQKREEKVLQREREREEKALRMKQKRVKRNKLIISIIAALIVFVSITGVLSSFFVRNSTRNNNVKQLQKDYGSYATIWGERELENKNYEDFKELFDKNYNKALFSELGAVPCGNIVRTDNNLYQIVDIFTFCYRTASSRADYEKAYETSKANGVTGVLLKKNLTTGACEVIHVFENPHNIFPPKKTFIGIVPKYIAGIENNRIYVQLLDNYSDHYFFNRIGEYNLTNGEYKVIEIEDSKNIEVNVNSDPSRYNGSMNTLIKDNKYYFYKGKNNKEVYCYDLVSTKTKVVEDITANR
ncbi:MULTISPECIES: hypothetical protein [Clostridium]|uniref:Uncharacterized protein n=1 Tax=Clostridium ragsdalei P11 TaxID=1353534 RepID=A0A1A6AVU2_9CLOT|nr:MULTISPECIES: hypothetical protein [Clostridium]OBR94145.1 hypothetical protein CLRAG_16850 [Clostridium ragsdalei P11]QXE20961.1 hypothetical protein B5S50_20070 [Clostridium sp. 001]